jgi:hypothetical protein
MQFDYPQCNKCKTEMKIGNFYGYCLPCAQKLSIKDDKINTMNIPSKKQKTHYIFNWFKSDPIRLLLVPIIVIVGFAGVCRAADLTLRWYLENNYTQAVNSVQAAHTACESSRSALVKLKSDNNEPLNGSDGCYPL